VLMPATTLLAWHVFAWLQHLVRTGPASGRWWLAHLPAELAAMALLIELAGGTGNPVSMALAVTGCLLVWRRAFIAFCFATSAYLLHSHYVAGPILSSLVASAAAPPIAMLALDALAARAKRIPVPAAAGLPSPVALVVSCTVLVFSLAIADLHIRGNFIAIAVMVGFVRLIMPSLRAL